MTEPISRRRFIGQASCAALGTTGVLSTLLNLGVASRLAQAATTPVSDYKALVCLFLSGGNDSYNLLYPQDNGIGEFNYYSALRSNLAQSPGRGILPANTGGRNFYLHSLLNHVGSYFDTGELALVANVGSLLAPLGDSTRSPLDDYNANHGKWPLGLYSHSDQVQQWQTGAPDKRTAIGWAGRAMDVLRPQQSGANAATFNISLTGMNILQTGNTVVPYVMSTDGLVSISRYDTSLTAPGSAGFSTLSLKQKSDSARTLALQRMLGMSPDSELNSIYRNIFEQTYAEKMRDANDAFAEFSQKLGGSTFALAGSNEVARQLALIAKVIGAYNSSSTKRQIFFVNVGGWDMHNDLIASQNELFTMVNDALGTFWSAPELTGMKNKVALFSASDFARTLTSNGDGADHAWGGHHFVLGGDVKGGKIFGDYPIFSQSSMDQINTGQGRTVPTTSVEEYVYPLLRWFGLSDSDIFGTVFPTYLNANRFNRQTIRKDLAYMNV